MWHILKATVVPSGRPPDIPTLYPAATVVPFASYHLIDLHCIQRLQLYPQDVHCLHYSQQQSLYFCDDQAAPTLYPAATVVPTGRPRTLPDLVSVLPSIGTLICTYRLLKITFTARFA